MSELDRRADGIIAFCELILSNTNPYYVARQEIADMLKVIKDYRALTQEAKFMPRSLATLLRLNENTAEVSDPGYAERCRLSAEKRAAHDKERKDG